MPAARRIRPGVNEGVVIGSGAVESELAGLVERVGGHRVVILTTPSVARSDLLAVVETVLGSSHVATFSGSKAHTPRECVVEAAAIALDAGADTLVSLGGSSVVDMTKGVAMVLAEGGEFDTLRVESGNRLVQPKLPHIAIPTTLSAAEFTSAAGITNPASGVKEIYASLSLAVRWVILDPLMAAATPQRLWAGTGMKLVADCLEGIVSTRATSYSNALLQAALQILLADLGAPLDDIAARGRCLEAAHMTLSNLHNVGVGAVAALRHQLGGRCGVPHGEASTIVLPHVMRWNGAAAAPALGRAADFLGEPSPAAVVSRVEAVTRQLELPTRLQDVDVHRGELDHIARHAALEAASRGNVRPANQQGLREILDAAY
ncbi:MAG: iron-containing alcohol dehydrogenase [Acidimicrobiales bacterium]|jgi:alcohol dehydrogenase class IV